MAMAVSDALNTDTQPIYPRRAAVISWIFFDWAAQPYFTLITTFVFAPYFATHVASDPASGQSLWGFATAAAGLLIALMSPVLLAYAIATVGAEFATVFNNAMMPSLVPPDQIGRLSGTGWATGYVGG